MTSDNKEKIINIIDKAAVFFFIVLVFYLPISAAAIESSFGFIFFLAILKGIFVRPSRKDIENFFAHKVNLVVLVFYIYIGLSLFVSGDLFFKSLKVYSDYLNDGGNPEEYKKSFSKIKKA